MVKILSLGEVLFDCLQNTTTQEMKAYMGGAPANVACGVVNLGVPAAFLGAIGDDEDGQLIRDSLGAVGVDLRGVQVSQNWPTRRVLVHHDPDGDRRFVGFLPADCPQFADEGFRAEDIPLELFTEATYLVVGTLGLAAPATAAAMGQSITAMHQTGGKVMVDLNWRPIFWADPIAAIPLIKEFLQQADYLKLSREEADLFFSDPDPQKIIQELWGDRPDTAVVITDGPHPTYYAWQGHQGKIDPFQLKPVDTTGAGDGFVAGWLYGLTQGTPDQFSDPQWQQDCLTFASAVGAYITLKPGAIAAQPTLDQVKEFLRDHDRRIISWS